MSGLRNYVCSLREPCELPQITVNALETPSLDHEKSMRILHIWDQAGVSGLLAEYQRKLGHYVDVICRDGYDGLKQKEYYNVRIIGPKRKRFKGFGLLQKPLKFLNIIFSVLIFYGYTAIHSRKFDVIHIHSHFLISFLIPFKQKIIEFHGDDIRSKPSKRWAIEGAVKSFYLRYLRGNSRFLVSTQDLLSELPCASWLPNPVDIELFSTLPKNGERLGKAVYFHNWYENGSHAFEIANQRGLALTVVDRATQRYLFFSDMPRFLNGFEWVIDRKEIHSLSKTALEALAMGCKVIDFAGNVHTELPMQHEPLNVATQTIQIYKEVLAK